MYPPAPLTEGVSEIQAIQLFKEELEKINQHPSREYFIYKSIILNNLYGVDIMEEATEICKLRLFLKLVSVINDKSQIEPLPDIDFNIKAGNALIGFASYKEIFDIINAKLDLGGYASQINEQAQKVSSIYRKFKELQTQKDTNCTQLADTKKELKGSLTKLNDELNTYLASARYGFDLKKKKEYDEFISTHQPFHWYTEFYEIIESGGFDVIIGNPPYVEYSKVKKDYQIIGYKTESCGNLYAFVVERCLKILKNKPLKYPPAPLTGGVSELPNSPSGIKEDNQSILLDNPVKTNKTTNLPLLRGLGGTGYCGMIVPISLVSTPKHSYLRKLLLQSGVYLNFSGDSNPSTLFSGVKQNLTIFIYSKYYNFQFTSPLIRFPSDFREYLFDNIFLLQNPVSNIKNKVIVKIGEEIHKRIFKKLLSTNQLLESSIVENSINSIYMKTTSGSHYKLFFKQPPFFSIDNIQQVSSSMKQMFFKSQLLSNACLAVLNSNLFNIWWCSLSDGRNVTSKEVNNFPFYSEETLLLNELEKLSEYLMKHLLNNSKVVEYKKSKGLTRYQEYYPRKSKHIIDEIDKVLAQHYGFTDEELDFIINYDIKYRMGLTGENDEEKTYN